jgi:hypothetical protein
MEKLIYIGVRMEATHTGKYPSAAAEDKTATVSSATALDTTRKNFWQKMPPKGL